MQKKRQPDKNNKQDDTDILSTIPPPVDTDPFAGLDIKGISISCANDFCARDAATDSDSAHPDLEDIAPEVLSADTSLNDIDISDIFVQNDKIFPGNDTIHVDAEPEEENPFVFSLNERENVVPSSASFQIMSRAADRTELSRIRENIFRKLPDSGSHVILMTAATDGTGLTLTAASLAYNIAQTTNQSVLLMDCNMRNPVLHTFLGVSNKQGIKEMILDNLPWQRVVRATVLPNLFMVTSGTATLQSFVKLPRNFFPALFSSLKKKFRWIIIDTSPVLTLNRGNIDTLLLSSIADYTFLLVNINATTQRELKKTKELFANKKGQLDAVICNHRPTESLSMSMLNRLRIRRGEKNG